jgi:transmembrane sensor
MNNLWNKWLDKTITSLEIEELKQSPDFEIYLKIIQKSENLQTVFTDEHSVLSKIIEQKPVKKLWPLWSKIAAVLIIGLSAILGFESQKKSTYSALKTQKIFSLPDASQVVLNQNAIANFKTWNWQNNRNLKLEGEAYFVVAKGKTFDVKTPNGTATVVGTKFSVLSKNNTFTVNCYEGKVKISNKKSSIYITKNQAAKQNGEGILEKKEVFISEPNWINNILVFENQPFKNVISSLSENYNMNFDWDQFKNQDHFSGKLPSKNLELSLKILSKTYHFKYKITNNQKVMITAL